MLPPFPADQDIIIGLLLFLRISMLVILLPVIGNRLVPPPVKIGISVLLTFLMYPVVHDTIPAIDPNPLMLGILAGKEILIAGMLALIAHLAFGAVQFAGQVISYQMGLAIANVFDPSSSAQIAVIGQFAVSVAMLVWLASGADQVLLRALSDSFYLIPIGGEWSFQGWEALNSATSAMFIIALRLTAPILLLLLFLYISLGLLARAVPQIQVFFVSFPLTVALGLFGFAIAMPAFLGLVHDHFLGLEFRIPVFLHQLAAG